MEDNNVTSAMRRRRQGERLSSASSFSAEHPQSQRRQQSSTSTATTDNRTYEIGNDTFQMQSPRNVVCSHARDSIDPTSTTIGDAEGNSSSTLTPTASGERSRHRSVTSLIRVISDPPNKNQQSCIFPMLPPPPAMNASAGSVESNSSQSLPFFDSTMSVDQVLKSPEQAYPGSVSLENNNDSNRMHNAGLILVTPNAIGKHIRAHITVETARLVSQVANLGTEDWLRLYNTFTAVEWNATTGNHDRTTATTTPSTGNSSAYLKQVAREMAISIEQADTGAEKARHQGVVLSIGMADAAVMLGFFTDACESLRLDEDHVCTLSLLEIICDKTLVDLSVTKTNATNPLPLLLHHPDQHGAVVKNLTQSPLDSENLEFLLRQGLRNYSSAGAIVATLTVWPSAVDLALNRLSKCQYLQFVHLPSSDSASSTTKIDRNTISLRQSLSSLGTILRHLVSQHDTPCSFRDGMLTKVLQRSLEPASTRVVVMGTVSSDIVHYERTAHTLNYIHQLFGTCTAESPFHPSSNSKEASLDCIPIDLTKHPAFLQSYVSDPRQRIAELERKVNRLLSPPHLQKTTPAKEAVLSDDDDDSPYRPTNYMDLDPLTFQSDYYKDPEEKKAESVVSPVKSNAQRELSIASISPKDEHDIDEHDDQYEWNHADQLYALTQEFTSSMQLSSSRAAESSRSLEYSNGELSLNMKQQRQQLERLEDAVYRRDSSIFGNGGESLGDEELLEAGESLVDEETYVEEDVEEPINDIVRKDKTLTTTERSSRWNADSFLQASHAESTSKSKSTGQHDSSARISRPATYRMDSKLSLMTSESDGTEESLNDEPSFGEDDVDESDNGFPGRSWNAGVEVDEVFEHNQLLDPPRTDVPGVIHEDETFEIAKHHSNEDLLVDTAAWDTPESNSKSKTPNLRRSLAAPPATQRVAPFRMDSKLSLMSSQSDEAGRPLVTTPGVPSSISLQIALEKARAPKTQPSPRSMDRLKRYKPPVQSEASSNQHFDIGQWAKEHHNNTVVGDSNGNDRVYSDFEELQGVIDDLRTRNVHSWKDKASALARLEQHFTFLQAVNRRKAKELDELEEQLVILDTAYTEELEKVTLEAEQEKSRAKTIARELELAASNSSSYEKVAEQAVSSIEGLHQETVRLEADLKRKELESEKRRVDYKAVLEENQRLVEKLKEVRNHASDMSFEQKEAEAIIEELESKVKSLTEDRNLLKAERDEDRLEMDVLKLESEDIVDAKSRLRAKEEEVDRLLQANDSLSATVFEQQKALSHEVEKREAESETLALEVQALTSELASAKQRTQDAAGDHQSFRNAVHEEQTALREKLREVEAERDHLHQLHNSDLSEMEALKLESVIRADLEKRLKAAGSEIDRLRAARGKVHDEIAVVRAEAATRVEEKDNAAQRLKLELHQAKIEVTSLRRRLADANVENDRIRKMSEEEHQRLSAKLGTANDELSRMRAELAESMHARNISAKDTLELKATIRARDEEVSNLQAQLDRVKCGQAESTAENKKLKESLHDLREKTRAQVAEIAEKTRENEIILENEKEKSSILDAEISRLLDELAKVRDDQELDRDDLGNLKDDLAKMQKEKADALNKAALLEKQLKEIELKAEDLEHELELTKLKSNEDLLRKVKEDYRSLQSANAQLTEAINGLYLERDGLIHDTKLLRRNLETVQKAKAATESKVVGLEQLLEQSKHMIDDLEHQLKIADMRSNGEPLKKARQDIRAHQKSVAELQVALEDMKNQRDEYHRALETRNADWGKREGMQRELESRIMKLENNKKEMEGQVSTMLSKLRITEHNANEIQRKLTSTRQSMEEMEQTRNDLREELDVTIRRRDEMEGACRELRQELETAITKRDEWERECSRNAVAEAQHNESDGRVRQKIEEEVERNDRIDSVVRAMEQEIGSLRHQLAIRSSDGATLRDLRAERERYEEASQLIVTLAYRAKTSTEQRDRMIRKLKTSLVQLSEEKEAEIQGLRARLHEWERSLVRDEEYRWQSR